MYNNKGFIITLFLSYIPFYSNSMTIKDIKKPIAVAWINDHEYVIGGKNGCIRGSCNKSKQLLNKKITKDRIQNISLNPSKTLLCLSLVSLTKAKQVLCNLEQNSVSDITFSDYFNTPTVFSTTNTSLLGCKNGNLIQYDYINKTIKKDKIPFLAIPALNLVLEHHPITDKCIYKSSFKTFTIITNINNALNIEKKMNCNDHIEMARYSPNGEFIAIENQSGHYFMCALNTNKDHIEAYELTHGNKKYIACAFHPKESIIALLSADAYIHYFNYITMKCIASIGPISQEYILDIGLITQRLDICSQGKRLIVALKNECAIIDIPQNNLFDIYKWLVKKEIHTDLKKYIFYLLMPLCSKNFSYFDLEMLIRVQQINTIRKNENDTIGSIENPKIVYVTLIHQTPNERIIPWKKDPINNPAYFLYSEALGIDWNEYNI